MHNWMVPFLHSMESATSNKKIKKYLEAKPVPLELPFRNFNWHRFICESKKFFKENILPFITFLAGGIAAFHYKKILELIGNCMIKIVMCSSCKPITITFLFKLIGNFKLFRFLSCCYCCRCTKQWKIDSFEADRQAFRITYGVAIIRGVRRLRFVKVNDPVVLGRSRQCRYPKAALSMRI